MLNSNLRIAIAIIVKDEVEYLKDWLDYHFNIGFNKIFLGVNDNEGPEKYPYLSEYGRKIKVFDLSGQEGVQKEFYNSIIDNEKYDWCAFIDTDEYITFKEGTGYKTIEDFLSDKKRIRTAKAYKMNWEIYGDDGHIFYEDKPVTECFIKPLPLLPVTYKFPEQYHTKSFLSKKEKHHFTTNPHTVAGGNYFLPDGTKSTDSPFNNFIEKSNIYIRHYYTKTIEEWCRHKLGRNYADYKRVPWISYYPIEKFFQYNQCTEDKINFLKNHGIEYTIKSEIK